MKGYEDLPDGTAFGVMSVESEAVWEQIADGTYQGFSVEGVFDYEKPLTPEQQALRTIEKLLKEIC